MEPLNREERRKAFFSFLIFFTITVVVVIAAVLFSIDVPFEQNEQLRSYKERVDKEKDFSENFFFNMRSTANLLDSINIKEVNIDLIDGKVSERLKSMDAMINDSLPTKDFYHDIVARLSELRSAKKELREANSRVDNGGELKQQVMELQLDLKAAKNQLEICKMMSSR